MNIGITLINFRSSLKIYQFSCIILLGHYLQSLAVRFVCVCLSLRGKQKINKPHLQDFRYGV